MGFFGVGMGKRQVMEGPGLLRIQGKVELILPAEFKPGLGQGIIPPLRGWMPLRQVCLPSHPPGQEAPDALFWLHSKAWRSQAGR